MAEPLPPYDTSVYPGIWECPDGAVDPRHLYWLADVLAAGLFRTALEIGSFLGTSGTAFVEAVNAGRLEHATFCDLEPRENLRRVLATCRDPTRLTLQPGRSIDLLARGPVLACLHYQYQGL
jgi:predicted O-methyltransferase YrrM